MDVLFTDFWEWWLVMMSAAIVIHFARAKKPDPEQDAPATKDEEPDGG